MAMNAIPRNRLAGFVDSSGFTAFIVGVILVNALVLALGTYETLDERYGSTLHLSTTSASSIFVIELAPSDPLLRHAALELLLAAAGTSSTSS